MRLTPLTGASQEKFCTSHAALTGAVGRCATITCPIRLCIRVVGGTVGWGGPTPIRLVIKCLCKLIRFDMEAYVDQLLDACMLHIFLPLIIHIANF